MVMVESAQQQLSSLIQRIRGSHHIYVKAGVPVRISVPVHGGMLKRGLQNYLMRVAQIEDSEL